MIIRTKLTEQDFVKVNFFLLYQRILIKILTVIGGLSILMLLIEFFLHLGIIKLEFSSFIFPFIILAGLPLMTYYGAKKNYKTANRIHEKIEYDFTPEYLDIKGESFTSQMGWNKFYKVTKSKDWLLIWQNRQAANIIPMKDVWESQLEELKEILQKNNVRNNI